MTDGIAPLSVERLDEIERVFRERGMYPNGNAFVELIAGYRRALVPTPAIGAVERIAAALEPKCQAFGPGDTPKLVAREFAETAFAAHHPAKDEPR